MPNAWVMTAPSVTARKGAELRLLDEEPRRTTNDKGRIDHPASVYQQDHGSEVLYALQGIGDLIRQTG